LNVSKFQNLLNIKFTLVLVFLKKLSPQDLNNTIKLHRYKAWREKPKKVFFYIFGLFETGNKKSKIGKNMEKGASPKSFTKILGKDFFLLRRRHYGDLPPQTHPNESQSSVHALSNLQS